MFKLEEIGKDWVGPLDVSLSIHLSIKKIPINRSQGIRTQNKLETLHSRASTDKLLPLLVSHFRQSIHAPASPALYNPDKI
jgi:hypothetical protein